MVFIRTKYTAKRKGAISRFVHCEHCGTEFAYTMIREAQGEGTSLYFLNEAGAEQLANQRAESNVQAALNEEVDVVACPKCRCFQAEMVREARRRYLKWMGPLNAFYGLFAVVPIFLVLVVILNGAFTVFPIVHPIIILGASIGLAVWFILMPFVRYYLSRRYDPNRDTAEQRRAPGYGEGIPRAIYERWLVEGAERAGGVAAEAPRTMPDTGIIDRDAKK